MARDSKWPHFSHCPVNTPKPVPWQWGRAVCLLPAYTISSVYRNCGFFSVWREFSKMINTNQTQRIKGTQHAERSFSLKLSGKTSWHPLASLYRIDSWRAIVFYTRVYWITACYWSQKLMSVISSISMGRGLLNHTYNFALASNLWCLFPCLYSTKFINCSLLNQLLCGLFCQVVAVW